MQKENQNPEIDKLFEEYDQIDINDDYRIIDFVEKHFDYLTHYKSDNITVLENIATMLYEYTESLGLRHQYKQIINRKEAITDFISRLKGKSSFFDTHFFNIEFNYVLALQDRKDYHRAIQTLKTLVTLYPKDEDVVHELRVTRFAVRQKGYNLIYILALIIIFCTLFFQIIFNLTKLELASNVEIALFVLTALIYYIDKYNQNVILGS